MDDIFGDNRNTDELNDERPQIVFANLRRPNRPILVERAYAAFSAITFAISTLVVIIFVWIFHIEVLVSQDLMISLAISSVELSALSLAVLGIIHEFNIVDRWFKLGLLLVAILFLGVVFGGFFLAITWQPDFDSPQQITGIVVAALGVVTFLQIDWNIVLRITSWDIVLRITSDRQRTQAKIYTRGFAIASTFFIPIFFLWFPGLNRITAIIILFGVALITLTVLACSTAVRFLSSPSGPEPEDRFITTLRKRYESQIDSIIRFGELKARMIDALQHLQTQSIQHASQHGRAPSLISESSIIVRLRQMNITEDERILNDVLSTLVRESIICHERYNHVYWTIPGNQTINSCLEYLKELALIYSEENPKLAKDEDYIIEGYKLTALRHWLATRAQLPEFIVGEYVMPKVLEWLLDNDKYHVIQEGKVHSPISIFVSRIWRISSKEWQSLISERVDKNMASENYGEPIAFTREFFLNDLPHTIDISEYTYELSLEPFVDENIYEIVSVLTERFPD
jgi:hypothetical protein